VLGLVLIAIDEWSTGPPAAAGLGLAGGSAGGLAGGLAGGESGRLAGVLVGGLAGALVGVLAWVFSGVLLSVLAGALVGMLAGVLAADLADRFRRGRAAPNEGFRRSVRSVASAALGGGLLFGLAGGLGGLLAGGLLFGGRAALQRYVTRAALVRAGVAPWRYGRFLDAMEQRLLLSRSGSAYRFVHQLLRDYLAVSHEQISQPPVDDVSALR
jgi:hypothetical protein